MAISEPVAARLVASLSGLVRTSRSYAHQRHEVLGPTGVTLGVLNRLDEGPARSAELACAMGVSASAVSRAVATVEALGYVTRTVDPTDARAQLLSLSPRGRDFLATQHQDHARRVGAVLSDWDDAKAITVLEGMAELDTALARTVAEMRASGIPTLTPSLETLTTTFADSVADDTTADTNQKAYA